MTAVFRRARRSEVLSPTGRYYIASPGALHPLISTMPGGPGRAELAEDGLHFARVGGVHHFGWSDIASIENEGGAILVQMKPSGGGYLVEVQPGEGADRWSFLLAKHGAGKGS